MDLALSLGMPVSQLSRVMTERELGRWNQYAAKRMLPWTRMEWYLAQIAYLIAVMGGSHATMADFLVKPMDEVKPEMTPEEQAEAAMLAFQVRPRGKRLRKRDGTR